MRILYFTRDYTPHDLRFLAKLAQTEHQIYYLQLERRGHATEDRPLPPEIEIVNWRGGRDPVGWRDGPQLLLDLKRVIRQVKPDLVQAGPIQRSAFLVALAGFRPLVTMSWGYDLLIDANRNALWRWATRFTLKRSAALVGDCNTIRRLAISHGMPDERIVTFPWGIDLGHFSHQSSVFSDQYSVFSGQSAVGSQRSSVSSRRSAVFTLLSTRGWEPIYGVDVIARAFVIAAQQRPELRLIMLGNGSLAADLRQIFIRGNVDERVSFPGHVGYADLPRYYRMADLYVCASHSDGTSISLLEAMACGRPALVSDIPGHREWVSPPSPPTPLPKGEGSLPSPKGAGAGGEVSLPSPLGGGAGGEGVGWLFPDGDADALARGILHAVEQWERLPEIGRAARRLAEERADWERNFPKWFEAYEVALGVEA